MFMIFDSAPFYRKKISSSADQEFWLFGLYKRNDTVQILSSCGDLLGDVFYNIWFVFSRCQNYVNYVEYDLCQSCDDLCFAL